MKNLFTLTASFSEKYASFIKFLCLIVLAFFVEYFMRQDLVLCEVGVSAFFALLAVFLFFVPLDKSFYSSTSRILVVAYTVFCIVLSLYENIFVVFALGGIVAISIAHRHSSPSLATLWVFPLMVFYLTILFELFVSVFHRINNLKINTPNLNLSKIFLYFLIPAFLSFIFLAIFSGGYAEFALVVENIISFIEDFLMYFFKINFWTFLAVFISLVALYETRISAMALITKDISFNLNEVFEKSFVICLVCFNLIFLSLNLINLKDLIFASNQYNLARDALNACDSMVLGSFFAGLCTLIFFLARNQSNILRTLLLVWLVQNLIIILTAFLKLYNYITEFHLTISRINGVFLMLFLAICTVLALSKMLSSMSIKALNNYIVYLALGLMSVYICVDKESFITKYNLNNSENPDFNYLKILSPYSLVAIYEYEEAGNETDMDLNIYIEEALKRLKHNSIRNVLLRAKLLDIQAKLKDDSILETKEIQTTVKELKGKLKARKKAKNKERT